MLKKGDIVWGTLYTTSEDRNLQQGRRPLLLLGNDKACEYSPIISVIPLSSKQRKEKSIPTHVLIKPADTLNGKLKKDSVALTEQLRCISNESLIGGRVDSVNQETMNEIEKNIKLQLGIA